MLLLPVNEMLFENVGEHPVQWLPSSKRPIICSIQITALLVDQWDKGRRHIGWNHGRRKESVEHGCQHGSQSPEPRICTIVRWPLVCRAARKLCWPPSLVRSPATLGREQGPKHLSLSNGAVKGCTSMRRGPPHGRQWGDGWVGMLQTRPV